MHHIICNVFVTKKFFAHKLNDKKAKNVRKEEDMRKVVKGTVVLTMAAGMTLWNMETQEAVALAPVTYGEELQATAILWEEKLQREISKEEVKEVSAKVTHLKNSRKVRVKQHKLEIERARRERKRLQRMREIQACCGVRVTDSDRTILERIVEAEAGNQGYKGKLLVANVVLNRVKSGKFPSTIKGVVFSPGQFSPISDGRYETVTVSAETKEAVDDALHGYDCSKGALYFMDRRYSDSSNVTWFDTCLTRVLKYGGHEFFK